MTSDIEHPRLVTLSSLLGRTVRSREGTRIGRLVDVTVRLSDPYPRIDRMLVRSRRAATTFVPWSAVERLNAREITLAPATAIAPPTHSDPVLDSAEILLRRDVLDTQVVDLVGLRLSRVSEILLASGRDGSLGAAAVDLGLVALLPRLGLRSSTSRPQKPVDWQNLHFASPRAHAVQISTDTSGYQRLDSEGLAELLTRLSIQSASEVLRTVDPDLAATTVHRSHPLMARRLLRALEPEEAGRLLEAMAARHSQRANHVVTQPSPLHERRYLRTAGWRRLHPVHVSPPVQGPDPRGDS